MAWTVKGTDVGAGRKTTGTAVATLTTGYATGDVLVAFIAKDPGSATGVAGEVGTGSATVSDSKSNVWVRAGEYRAGASAATTGIIGGIFYTQVTTALVSGDTVQVNVTSNVPAKAISVQGFTGITPGQLSNASTSGFTTSGTATGGISLANLTSRAYLFIVAQGVENTVNNTTTADAGWTSLTQQGTSGGSGGSNIKVKGSYLISTATGAVFVGTDESAPKVAVMAALYDTNPPAAFPAHRFFALW